MTYDLDELERLALAATDGPWESYHEMKDLELDCFIADLADAYVAPSKERGFSGGSPEGDADLIAAARTAIPELVAEVRRLREKAGEKK